MTKFALRPATWRGARRATQIVSLLFFGALVVWTARDAHGALTSSDLMSLDPLAGLAAMLASRQWLARFWPALVLLAATVLLGRFWCGWLCPLGTLIDWVSPARALGRAPQGAVAAWWRRVPSALLVLLAFAALWGNLTLLILDPLTIFVRSVTTLVLPAVHWGLLAIMRPLYRVGFLGGALDALDTALQGTLLSYEQPTFQGVVILAALLAGILALNWVKKRFWCRYICPLGGLLGLAARLGPTKRRVSDACIACGRCARDCRMGAVEAAPGYASNASECILCHDCDADCPKDAIGYSWTPAPQTPHPGPTRRQFLLGVAGSVGGLALLRVNARAQGPQLYRLRPPGAEEQHLLSACVRCGACLRACPTHGLQPALSEAGLEGLWTPILMPRLGNCDYGCTACGETCPTGAIPLLSLADKRLAVIGKARIDPVRCLAWSKQAPCIVCEEMCPLPAKAITLIEQEAQWPDGSAYTLQLPVVAADRCIGCGLCEKKCPVSGEAAIRVTIDPLG